MKYTFLLISLLFSISSVAKTTTYKTVVEVQVDNLKKESLELIQAKIKQCFLNNEEKCLIELSSKELKEMVTDYLNLKFPPSVFKSKVTNKGIEVNIQKSVFECKKDIYAIEEPKTFPISNYKDKITTLIDPESSVIKGCIFQEEVFVNSRYYYDKGDKTMYMSEDYQKEIDNYWKKVESNPRIQVFKTKHEQISEVYWNFENKVCTPNWFNKGCTPEIKIVKKEVPQYFYIKYK